MNHPTFTYWRNELGTFLRVMPDHQRDSENEIGRAAFC